MVGLSKSWIEISRSALEHNYRTLSSLAGKSGVMCVIKGEAYGHGLDVVGPALSDFGARLFAVDSAEEAYRLRLIVSRQARIHVLGYVPPEAIAQVMDERTSFVLFNQTQLDAVEHHLRSSWNRTINRARASIHLPLETGLHREGWEGDELRAVLKRIADLHQRFSGAVQLEGVQMHFANVEDTDDPSFANEQIERFEEMVAEIKEQGFDSFKTHTASSAASLLYSKTHFDFIRPGIALYGLWPAEKTRVALTKEGRGVDLKPVLSWKSVIAQIKSVRSGEPIGYGLTERVQRDSKIAVIPVGYYDCYDRGLSGKSEVLIGGRRCKLLGRVCMNMIMVDITDVPDVSANDEVVLIGSQGSERVSADELAEILNTINYEIVARLNPLIPRIIV